MSCSRCCDLATGPYAAGEKDLVGLGVDHRGPLGAATLNNLDDPWGEVTVTELPE